MTLAVAIAAHPASLGAQASSPSGGRWGAPQAEGRGELIAARATTVHAGVALLWPVSPYLRVGPLVAGGVTRQRAMEDVVRESDPSLRAEMVARFTPDPRPSSRWRLYGQASAGVLAVRGHRGRSLVSAAVGMEAPSLGGGAALRPALEVGVGGGLRVGIALRGALP